MMTSPIVTRFSKLLLFTGTALVAACASPNSHRTSVLSQIEVGERMLGYGDYDRGYALLERIAEHNPRSSMTALGLGDAYFRQKAYLKASAQYQKAVKLGARIEGLLGLARVELARNNPEGAAAYLREVLARDPDNVDAINAMGVVHDLRGEHAAAQQYYQSVLAYAPANKEALNNFSLSLALSGQATQAYPYIAELSRSNQNDPAVHQNLALIQYLAGYQEQALRTALLDLTEDEARANFAQLSGMESAQ